METGRLSRQRESSSTRAYRKLAEAPTKILSPAQARPSPSPRVLRPARRPPFVPGLPDALSQTETRQSPTKHANPDADSVTAMVLPRYRLNHRVIAVAAGTMVPKLIPVAVNAPNPTQ